MKTNGFTFIELIVATGVVATLIGLIVINSLGAQRRSTLTQNVNILISDLRSQQTKTMTGAEDHGVVTTGYGIYFESDEYTMFSGSSYRVDNQSNAVVTLDPTVTMTTRFPGNTVTFLPKSGEIFGYTEGLNTITLQWTDSMERQTIHLNLYGTISSIE